MLHAKTLPAVLLLAATPIAAAQTASFTTIPGAFYTADLTPDGRYIVGALVVAAGGTGYRYDLELGVMLPLPGSFSANAISDDGTTVLGDVPEGVESNTAAIWTAGDGWQSIGYLPNALTCPSLSDGYEMSGDGSIAVGLSWDGCNGRGFMWTEEAGMVELDVLANGGNRASVITGDGSLIGGFAQTTHRSPAIWDANTGVGQLLDPTGVANGEIRGASDDGTILLGLYDGQAIRWTAEDGVEVLGAGSILPGWNGNAMDVADDGTVIGFDSLFGNYRGWIQPQGVGPLLPLKEYVIEHGGTVPDTDTFDRPSAISADGLTITGNSWPNTLAWIVTFEPDCPADVTGDGVVSVNDLVEVITSWGPCPGCPADVNGDDEVDVDDLVQVITGWGGCP